MKTDARLTVGTNADAAMAVGAALMHAAISQRDSL